MIKNPVVLAAIIIILVLAGAIAQQDGLPHRDRNPVTVPTGLKFPHKLHVKDQGMACQDCHGTMLASTKSTDRSLGDHATCGTCHESQVASECAFCHTDPENIQPAPVDDRELIFSHQLHAEQKIECTTCHAGIDTVTTVRAAALPTMAFCMECHEQQKVSNECATCHSDVPSLIPENHLRADFRKEHERLVRAGTMEVTCATCHEETFCQDCHTGTQLRAFTARGGLMSDPSPRQIGSTSARQLRLQQVHTLNYRFTHGVDARAREIDCQSCHDQQDFCSQCHEAGTINQAGVRPASHNQPGFTTLGKGSGGGLHATLGRRDLESCASCHDVQGQDPVCTTCHGENGSVR